MKLIYRVTVNFQDFDFTDHVTADQFAALAKVNAVKDEKTKSTIVKVEYLTEEEAKK